MTQNTHAQLTAEQALALQSHFRQLFAPPAPSSSTQQNTNNPTLSPALAAALQAHLLALFPALEGPDHAANIATNTTTPASSVAPAAIVIPAPNTGPNAANAQNTIICPHCQGSITLPDTAQRWYTIYAGHRVGWVQGLAQAQELTMGVSGNRHQYFPDEISARNAFWAKHGNGETAIVGPANAVYPALLNGQGFLMP